MGVHSGSAHVWSLSWGGHIREAMTSPWIHVPQHHLSVSSNTVFYSGVPFFVKRVHFRGSQYYQYLLIH